jgi:hypothetical protein
MLEREDCGMKSTIKANGERIDFVQDHLTTDIKKRWYLIHERMEKIEKTFAALVEVLQAQQSLRED